MSRTFLVFLTIVGILPTADAEQLYVLLEEGCADRIRYEQAIASQPRADYFAYSFLLPDGGRLSLETGVEGGTVRSTIPIGYIGCNDPRLNAKLVDRVESAADQVFVLRPALNNQFYVHEVRNASVLRRYAGLLSYRSPLASFRMEESNAIVGENITYGSPTSKVVFEGRDLGPCGGVYLFQQMRPESANPISNYRIAPALGMLERRIGSDGLSSSGGVVVARSVNGTPVQDYLATHCADLQAGRRPGGGQIAGTAPLSPAYGGVPPAPAPSTSSAPAPPAPATYGTTAPPYPQPEARGVDLTPAPIAQTTHVVKKGETLWGLGNKYGTSPDAIRRLNGMTGNTIFPGQTLMITSFTAPTPAPSIYASAAPVPPTVARYGGTTHVVRPGETVASIALRSGYTEDRFRQINNLSPDAVALVGQTVITDHCGSQAAPSAPATTTARPITLPDTPLNSPAPPVSSPPAPRAYGSATVLQPRSGTVVTDAPPTTRRYGDPTPDLSRDPFAGVPVAAPAASAPPTQSPVNPAPAPPRAVHTVQNGESLWMIAERYHTTTDVLRQLNNMSPSEVVVPFQKLYVN